MTSTLYPTVIGEYLVSLEVTTAALATNIVFQGLLNVVDT
jgi:hypothetical protein